MAKPRTGVAAVQSAQPVAPNVAVTAPQGPIYHDPKTGERYLGGLPGTPNSRPLARTESANPLIEQQQQAALEARNRPYNWWDYATGRGPGGVFGPSSPLNVTDRPTNVTLDPREMYKNEPWWPAFEQFVKDWALGKESAVEQIANFSPEEMEIFNQVLQGSLGQFQNPTQGFEPIENEARQNFYNKTVPGIAEQFTASSGGRLSSPLFAQQLGTAGAGLESVLAAQKADYGMKNRFQGLQGLQLGLTPKFTNYVTPGTPGAFVGAAQSLVNAAPTLAQAYLGMPG
jgi:hypothetical protein